MKQMLGLVLAASMIVGVAQAGKTAEKKPSPPKPDTVTAVDWQNYTFKVAGEKEGKEVAYNITALTEIFVNGKSAKFEEVKKGMKISVVSSDGKNASRIEAEGGLGPPPASTKKKSQPKKKK